MSCIVLIAATTTVYAQKAPTKVDGSCVKMDLEVFAMIEKYETRELDGAAILVDVATLIEFARSTCANGDITTARVIYRSAMQQLDAAVRELRNPLELPPALI
jgi:hypothetical protein